MADLPFGSLQIIVGLFQLAHVFVQLVLDAARLAEVVLQHGDLLVALRALLLQFVLETTALAGMRSSDSDPPHLDPEDRIHLIYCAALCSFYWEVTYIQSGDKISWKIGPACI